MDLAKEILDAQKKAREENGRYDLGGRHFSVFNHLPVSAQDLWTLEIGLPVSDLSLNILVISKLMVDSGKGYLIRQPPPIDEKLYWKLIREAKAKNDEEDAILHKPGPNRKKAPERPGMFRKRTADDPPQKKHLLRVNAP